MKQIRRLKLFLAATVLLASFASTIGLFGAPSVLAAGCIEHPSTDSQATAQMDCVQKYIQTCKEKYNKSFCNNLSVKDINKCAGDGYKLKDTCAKNLEKAYLADAGKNNNNTPDDSNGLGGVRNPNDCKADSFDELDKNHCEILNWIVVFTRVMSGIAGTVITGMIILGGIQYSAAGADPSKVQAAKKKITNALLALVLFIFGFAFLQWIVPGGIL